MASIKTITKFTDVNVDGCGTNVETVAILTGPDITKEIIEGVNKAIEECKIALELYYSTDDCLNAAKEYLNKQGFQVEFMNPEIEFEF